MEIVFSDLAKKELENLPQELKLIFLNCLEKMMVVPPRKRMKHGIPCHVVNAPLPKGRGFYRFCEEIASPISGC